MASIYDRMAASPLRCTNQLTSGVAPQRKFIAQFVYMNDLVVNYDGTNWSVIRNEGEAPKENNLFSGCTEILLPR